MMTKEPNISSILDRKACRQDVSALTVIQHVQTPS